MTESEPGAVLSLIIQNESALYDAYMSFLQNGGLFVPTNQAYTLGDEVLLLLTLLDEPAKLPVAGKVVWITPAGAQGNRQAGIGIEFSEEDTGISATIEKYLGGALGADRATHTL